MNEPGRVLFYGAMSVDGYLAREDHSLDWLIGTEGEEEAGYNEFYNSIDTVVMGRKTYEQIQILSPDEFPYSDKKCYVFSRSLTGTTDFVEFVDADVTSFFQTLKSEAGKRIWIVGGGEILQPLLQEKMVDEFFIQIAPSIIGKGIPLFIPADQQTDLKLLDVRRYKQLAELHYVLKTGK